MRNPENLAGSTSMCFLNEIVYSKPTAYFPRLTVQQPTRSRTRIPTKSSPEIAEERPLQNEKNAVEEGHVPDETCAFVEKDTLPVECSESGGVFSSDCTENERGFDSNQLNSINMADYFAGMKSRIRTTSETDPFIKRGFSPW